MSRERRRQAENITAYLDQQREPSIPLSEFVDNLRSSDLPARYHQEMFERLRMYAEENGRPIITATQVRRATSEVLRNINTTAPIKNEEKEQINLFTDIFLPPKEEYNMKTSDNSVLRFFKWFRKKRNITECPLCGGDHEPSRCILSY